MRRLGLDTISAGATIAFAMECAERGLLDEPTACASATRDMLLSLLRAHRPRARGWATCWPRARGGRRRGSAARRPTFAPHVKGLEIPGYEPRALQTMALGFAVGSRGADHNRCGAYEVDFSARADRLHGSPDAAALAVETEDRAALIDSLILCKFLRGVFADLYAEAAELLAPRHRLGRDGRRAAHDRAAHRHGQEAVNLREGWTAAEDTLPERFLAKGWRRGPAGAACRASGCSHGPRLRRPRLDEGETSPGRWRQGPSA